MSEPIRRPVPAPLAVLAVFAFASTAAAQVVTVGPWGSGAMFDRIQDGIAAAPPGGVVLVAAANYHDTSTLVIDKPLSLLGAGRSVTRYFATIGGSPTPVLPLRVSGLLPGQAVLVAGLALVSQATAPLGHETTMIVVENCAGPVVLTDLAGGGYSFIAPSLGVVQVRDSAQVTLEGCDFAAFAANVQLPVPALRVERSFVFVNRSRFAGSSGFPVHDGAPGVVAIDATVRLARSRVSGGAGAQIGPLSSPTVATKGGAAIDAIGSQVLVRGGAGNELRGGLGGTGQAGGLPLSGPGGAAIQLDAASLAATTPDSVLIAGLDGNQQANTPPVDGPGAVVPLAVPLAVAAAVPSLVAPGGTLAIELGGEPTAVVVPFASLGQVAPFPVPGMLGVVTLDLGLLVALPLAVLDANGAASVAIALPANPTLVGVSAHVQSVAFAPSGAISVSGPTSFVVR